MMIIGLFILLILIVICTIFFEGIKNKYKNYFYVVIGVILTLFAAFRDGNSVRDYQNYLNYFDSNNLILIEPSFVFIKYVTKNVLGLDVIFLFIIYSFGGVLTKLKGVKQISPFLFFSLLIYLSNFYILHELTQIRAGVASGILLLCIKPIYERNLKVFLLLVFIATLFHYSAILLLPLWFVGANTISKKVFMLIIPLGIIIYLLKIDLILNIPISIIKDKIVAYKELQEYDVDGFNKINVFNTLFLFRCGMYYFFLINIETLNNKNKYTNILIKIYGISLAVLPAFATMPVVAFRLNELLSIVEIVLLPFIIYIIKPKIFPRIFLIIVAVCLLLFNIYYNQYVL